jgi:hypothetical protein
LFIRKTDRANPHGPFIFIDLKDDAILLVDEMAEGGIFSRARAPLWTPAQGSGQLLKPLRKFSGS